MLLTVFSSDKDLSKLDDKLIQILAWQRLQQLLPSKTSTSTDGKGSVADLVNQGMIKSVFLAHLHYSAEELLLYPRRPRRHAKC